MKILFAIVGLILSTIAGYSQTVTAVPTPIGQPNTRAVSTAMPFLRIAPDARAGAMGDIGAATTPDVNSMYWNIAKLAFVQKDIGFGVSYTPWLGKVVRDMSLSYISMYTKIDKLQAVGFALNYFDIGDMTFTNTYGAPIQSFNPREFSLSGSYSRVLSKNMGVGATIKYLRSNIAGNFISSGGVSMHPANGMAVDVGWYYNLEVGKLDANNLAFGVTIVDIGNKVTYSGDDQKEFIPTTLRIGTAYTKNFEFNHGLTLSMDFTKLLVPTISTSGDPLINGMISSFVDAPDGITEELKEIMIGSGMEYNYNNVLYLRAGYFWENFDKGNRQYFTAGVGFAYNVFGANFAYLIPTSREHPLAETLRFSLLFDFMKSKPNKQEV